MLYWLDEWMREVGLMGKKGQQSMHQIKYIIAKAFGKLTKNSETISDYLRSQGMIVGRNCHIYSDLFTAESFLVEIGDNVTISNGVQLITHDNSICKVLPEFTDTFGAISIGNNSFIGAKAVIMRGVSIPQNTIVGAGSVVTHSFTVERTIIAGNPAKVVSDWDTYAQKYANIAVNISGCKGEDKKSLILQSAKCLRNRW